MTSCIILILLFKQHSFILLKYSGDLKTGTIKMESPKNHFFASFFFFLDKKRLKRSKKTKNGPKKYFDQFLGLRSTQSLLKYTSPINMKTSFFGFCLMQKFIYFQKTISLRFRLEAGLQGPVPGHGHCHGLGALPDGSKSRNLVRLSLILLK